MSMMGGLTFFLGTFVHQSKYMKDIMKKLNMAEPKPVSTPMSTITSLGPDEDGDVINQREYRSMIGPSCTLQQHGRTFSSLCVYVRAFRLPHALHTG
jgi:hypothetical protein